MTERPTYQHFIMSRRPLTQADIDTARQAWDAAYSQDDQSHLRMARGVINGLWLSLFCWLAVAGFFTVVGFVFGLLIGGLGG